MNKMTNKTELANAIIDDGQLIRASYNYFRSTFESVKGETLNFDESIIDNEVEFYNTLKYALEILIENTEQ
jgi:hypothetical protein